LLIRAESLPRPRHRRVDASRGAGAMRVAGFNDFLVGLGMVFVLEGLLFAAFPGWIRGALKSALASPDAILRAIGLGSSIVGLILIWLVRQ